MFKVGDKVIHCPSGLVYRVESHEGWKVFVSTQYVDDKGVWNKVVFHVNGDQCKLHRTTCGSISGVENMERAELVKMLADEVAKGNELRVLCGEAAEVVTCGEVASGVEDTVPCCRCVWFNSIECLSEEHLELHKQLKAASEGE